jgi:hypothetical protein
MPTKLEQYNSLKEKVITIFENALDFKIDAFFNLYRSDPKYIPGTIINLRHDTCDDIMMYGITFQHTSTDLLDSLSQISPHKSYDYTSFLSMSLMNFNSILNEPISMIKWELFEFEISQQKFEELHKKYLQSYIISQTTSESMFKVSELNRILDRIEQFQIEFDTIESIDQLSKI